MLELNSCSLRALLQTYKTVLCRSYYSSRRKKPTLYTILSPLGAPTISLTHELNRWVARGKRIRIAEVQRIIRDFRKHKRFSQALQVSDWMRETEMFLFSTVEHAVHLDLIGRVRGYTSAEKYFENLRDKDKNNKTYGALLNCYVRQRLLDKSCCLFTKMKKLGFANSALSYNNLMCLYTNLGEYEKVPSLFEEMKNNDITPDNYTYRLCINSYGVRLEITNMEKTLEEMKNYAGFNADCITYSAVASIYIKSRQFGKALNYLRLAEERLSQREPLGYNHLITHYAAIGDKEEVLRIWELQKEACGRHNNTDYRTMLESLLKLGEVEEAEKIVREWEVNGKWYDERVANVMVVGYCELGLCDRGEEYLTRLMTFRRATTPNSWANVGRCWADKGDMERAFFCINMAFDVYKEGKGWKPNPRVVFDIVKWLEDQGRVEDGKKLMFFMRKVGAITNSFC